MNSQRQQGKRNIMHEKSEGLAIFLNKTLTYTIKVTIPIPIKEYTLYYNIINKKWVTN